MRGEYDVAVEASMRAKLIAKLTVVLLPLLLGGWFDDPPAWARPDGRPIDPVVFQRNRSVCRGQASVFAGREVLWITTFRDCMQQFGYVPLRRDILP
jgi:hypothetical protein